jgi:nucleoside 2-deoxyribosyltransferase
MRIYVAGRTSHIEIVNEMQELCRADGHTITHDWTGPEGGIESDWSGEPERAYECARKDFNGVTSADAVIVCGYGCGEGGGGLGTFIEIGIAIHARLPVIIIGPMRESVFWYLDNVIRYSGTNEISEEIKWALYQARKMTKIDL